MKKKALILCLCLFILGGITGCGGTTTDQHTAVFADADWDSIKFHNAVAMYIAETAYDMQTEELSGTTAITYTALKGGDISVYMEMWTDNLSAYDDDVADGSIKELSVNFDDNNQGFYVPRYVIEGDADRGIEAVAPDLKTVEDLKNYSDVFIDPDDPSMGRLYGAISGWEVDTVMRNKYAYYGLDSFYNYMDPGSSSALAAAISSAYEKG
jgi:glycine betaine/proline transport system permease protein/glycine betaine/proline transport system substrate-binding protein